MNHKQLVEQLNSLKAEVDTLRSKVETYENVENDIIAVQATGNVPTSRRRMLKRFATGVAGFGALAAISAVPSQSILAATPTDSAVEATSGPNGYALEAISTFAQIHMSGATTAGAPTTGQHQKGELFTDSNGDLWYCAVGDNTNAGTWRKVSGSGATGISSLLPSPDRFLDTRSDPAYTFVPNGSPSGPLTAATTTAALTTNARTYQMTGRAGKNNGAASTIPAGATTISGNVTIISHGGGGFLTLWANGNWPGTATVNFAGGAVVNNFFTCPLSAAGAIKATSNDSVDVIIDIISYTI